MRNIFGGRAKSYENELASGVSDALAEMEQQAALLGAGAVVGGLAVFLVLTPPGGGISTPGVAAWAPVILATTAIATSSILVATRTSGPARLIALAAAAGVTYGVLDARPRAGWTCSPRRALPHCCAGSPARCWPWASSAPGPAGPVHQPRHVHAAAPTATTGTAGHSAEP